MAGCTSRCGHYRMVMSYRDARHAAELARESATGGYRSEVAEFRRLITFKDWLTGTAGAGW